MNRNLLNNKKSNKRQPFYDKLDNIFVISRETKAESGEDSFLCGVRSDSAIAAVFDGCGGLGSRRYPGFSDKTGAYIASRIASGAVYDWFNDYGNSRWESSGQILESMNRYLREAFDQTHPYSENALKLRGSMVRDFPSTAAIAYVTDTERGIRLHIIWAGDSRVYILDKQGLAQVTLDDVDDKDALSNLYTDGAKTNILSSDGRFILHYRSFVIEEPLMIMAATDGIFGYLLSPMHLENAFLDALLRSASMEEFRIELNSLFRSKAGDDYALAFMACHFGSFKDMQDYYREYYRDFRQKYMVSLEENPDRSHIEEIWKTGYKGNYERLYGNGITT